MNYIKLINAFWQKRRERPEFDPYVISLFFALVSKANNEGWKSFEIYREDITALSGMSPSVYYKARKTLKDAGFIDFQEGASKLSQCRFNIIQLYSENTEGYTEGSTESDTEETQKAIQKAIQKAVPSKETYKPINPKPLNNLEPPRLFQDENSESLKAEPEKPKEKSSAKKEKVNRAAWKDLLQMPYQSEAFAAKWEEWIANRKAPYKTQVIEQRELTKLSAFNEAFAIFHIDRALAGNWTGLTFPETTRDFQRFLANQNQIIQSNGQPTHTHRQQQHGAGADLEAAVAMSRFLVGDGYKQAG